MRARHRHLRHLRAGDVGQEQRDAAADRLLFKLALYGVIFGGWAANSKYAVLGSLRTCAQMISYEIPMGFAVIGVVMRSDLRLQAHSILPAPQAPIGASWRTARVRLMRAPRFCISCS
jgi:hypothetical protein